MADKQPNILVIWGDDIGITNLSCYSDGLMGYRTPNIDRIANEGMRFTDSYGEQSCTAGRAAFITGQSVFRTGLSKVGLPGADHRAPGGRSDHRRAAQDHSATPRGSSARTTSATRTTFLPTVHGFDEFFGNLYHLNAEEEPEPPTIRRQRTSRTSASDYGPRGVIHSWANADGTQRDRRHRPAHQEADGDVDDEFLAAAQDFIERQVEADTPFFVWFNTTHMHFRTHPKPESIGQAGRWQSPYHDTMIDHDKVVGALLDQLDELGIAENTIVLYSAPTTDRT